ncbi:MAG: hypothetical protein R3C45_09225 [Phycisphaerales bacterium]
MKMALLLELIGQENSRMLEQRSEGHSYELIGAGTASRARPYLQRC